MMVLTERALKLEKKLNQQGAAADLEKFADKSEVASYAVSSVAAMIKEGLIEGGDNKVNPTGNTTRAEAAVILYRLYNK
ncbi:Endo-1,4-beta-xylanase A precursor [compost metagenome]